VTVRRSRVFVSGLAVFVGRRGVGFGFIVLALRMMMSRLEVMVGGGLVGGSSIVVVLAGRILVRLSHLIVLQRSGVILQIS
jgi:hypothetical protein